MTAYFWEDGNVLESNRWQLNNTVNVLHVTELFIFNRLILGYRNFTPIKKKWKWSLPKLVIPISLTTSKRAWVTNGSDHGWGCISHTKCRPVGYTVTSATWCKTTWRVRNPIPYRAGQEWVPVISWNPTLPHPTLSQVAYEWWCSSKDPSAMT